jgi:hypothetical protein
MKLENVIIYTGKDLKKVNLDYFFQDELISKITKDTVIDAYTHQKIFVTLAKNAIKNNEQVIVENLLDKDRLVFPKLEKGLVLLEGMIMDMHGDKAGAVIIDNINHLTLQECQ